MSLAKKIIAGVVVIALLGGAAVGAGMYMKKSNQKEVMVVGVDSLASDYYMQDTNLEGYITTSVSQNVSVDKDMIIEEVYVSKGDSVKKGDLLISFDMTLVEMELKIAKLKKEQQELELNKAVNRLQSLQNGGPVIESDADSPGTADDLSSPDAEDGEDDLASALTEQGGQYLAAAVRPMLLAVSSEQDVFDDGTEEVFEEIPDIESSGADAGDIQVDDFGESEDYISDGEGMDSTGDGSSPRPDFSSGEENTVLPEPTPTPVLGEDEEYFDPYTTDEEVPGITDGEETFYRKLDWDSQSYDGGGAKDDPFIFLCSGAKGKVVLTGAFLNKMAGYNADGTELLHEGGFWYRLEFHQYDTITNYEDLKESCIGYYLIDGGMLEAPVYEFAEMEFTVEGADTYEPEEEEPIDDGGFDGSDDFTPSISRSEAIKIQKDKISNLKLDLQESDIKIAKLEKKVKKQSVYSKLDGTVSYVGDPVTGTSDGNSFISVKSKDGFYVKGSVSELMLDEMQEGTKLNCTSYENGSFEAEVIDVSEYPVSSDSYFGDGNPNVSYYSYSAVIPDQSIKFSDQDWLNITLQSEIPSDGSIVLAKAFVRTEDGVSYVYKDDNGVLKKQILKVGGNTDGGYSVLIKSGITREDKIAFPYGKSVVEGAKTKEGTLDELYGY